MSEDAESYFSYAKEIVPEGRRVFALIKAVELSDTGTSPAKVLKLAKVFEAFLESPKPKIAAVKNES